MGPEAKADGKAAGYADGSPAESRIGSSAMSQTSVSNRDHPGMYDWQEMAASVGSGAETQQDPPVSHPARAGRPGRFRLPVLHRSLMPRGQVPHGSEQPGNSPGLQNPHQT